MVLFFHFVISNMLLVIGKIVDRIWLIHELGLDRSIEMDFLARVDDLRLVYRHAAAHAVAQIVAPGWKSARGLRFAFLFAYLPLRSRAKDLGMLINNPLLVGLIRLENVDAVFVLSHLGEDFLFQ